MLLVIIPVCNESVAITFPITFVFHKMSLMTLNRFSLLLSANSIPSIKLETYYQQLYLYVCYIMSVFAQQLDNLGLAHSFLYSVRYLFNVAQWGRGNSLTCKNKFYLNLVKNSKALVKTLKFLNVSGLATFIISKK